MSAIEQADVRRTSEHFESVPRLDHDVQSMIGAEYRCPSIRLHFRLSTFASCRPDHRPVLYQRLRSGDAYRTPLVVAQNRIGEQKIRSCNTTLLCRARSIESCTRISKSCRESRNWPNAHADSKPTTSSCNGFGGVMITASTFTN